MAPGVSLSRGAPVCCAAVENFVNDRHLRALQRKVSHSRTSINNNWSQEEERRLQTSRRNVKREQVRNDRFANIEGENMRLLMKMQEIEHRGPARAAASAVLGPPPPKCARGGSLPPVGTGSKSNARVRELRRIDEDNQRLLRRLQGAKSSVCLPALEEQHQRRQKVMRMRCEHQRSEWRELYPPPKLGAARLQQPLSPVDSEGQIDAECERLLQLQERLRSKMDLATSLSDTAAWPEAESEGQPSPRSAAETPSGGIGSMLGGVLPASSKAMVDSLLAEDAARHAAEMERLKDDPNEDAEDAANAAKEAAANALRMAMAVDASSEGLLAYGDVVQRFR
mmetsp:Transcript_1526/g.4596  ORF Transcript_1526/g.4596 Transcript_1526/m.4596 type:complete len:339 (+) Transcript_1526:68-1084(+)